MKITESILACRAGDVHVLLLHVLLDIATPAYFLFYTDIPTSLHNGFTCGHTALIYTLLF